MSYVFDEQAEKEAIALCFASPAGYIQFVNQLEEEDFNCRQHKMIFRAIKIHSCTHIDNITVGDILLHLQLEIERGKLSTLYIYQLIEETYGATLDAIIPRLKNLTKVRKLLKEAGNILHESQTLKKGEEETFLEKFSTSIHNITLREEEFKPFEVWNNPMSVYEQAMDMIERKNNGETIFHGHSTGFIDIDKVVNGLPPGHLIVIGARPGQGKSSLMVNLIKNMRHLRLLVFSLEMNHDEINAKINLSIANVNFQNYRDVNLSPEEIHRIHNADKELEDKKIIIYDRARIRPKDINAISKRYRDTIGLDAIFIDYLALLGSDNNEMSEELRISSITRSLKILAKEMKVPVILLAQINREAEKNEKSRPLLSHLKGSGAIEADADQCWLLQHTKSDGVMIKPGVLLVHIDKNRFGSKKTVEIGWDPSIELMGNYSEEEDFNSHSPITHWQD